MNRSPDDEVAGSLESLRPVLYALCYSMLGSPIDAEDAVQESMLRVWRARSKYDTTLSGFRTWASRIATNVCIDLLRTRSRRPLPSDLQAAGLDANAPLEPALDVPWLKPAPTRWFVSDHADRVDPVAAAVRRGDLRVAVMVMLQTLPPRQRAAFVLRDLLGYPAGDAARLLELSIAACNSALQRARAKLDSVDAVRRPSADHEVSRAVVTRYAEAFERADVDALVALVSDDVRFEMPPVPTWSVGLAPYEAFMRTLFTRRGRAWTIRTTSANGQPAMLVRLGVGRAATPHTVQVFEVSPDATIRHVLVYQDAELFGVFDRVASDDFRGVDS